MPLIVKINVALRIHLYQKIGSERVNPPMQCVLFLQFCSMATVIFLTLNLYIVLNTKFLCTSIKT